MAALGKFRFRDRWSAFRDPAFSRDVVTKLENRDHQLEDWLSDAGISLDALRALSAGYVKADGSGGFSSQAAPIPATDGGTGNASYAVGDLLYASTTTALSKLADVATGNALISGGVSTAPSYGKIGLTTHVSGTLGYANGGWGVDAEPYECRVRRANTQTFTTGVQANISFDTEDHDPDGLHSSGTFTVNRDGWWIVTTQATYSAQVSNRNFIQFTLANGSGTLPTGVPLTFRSHGTNEDQLALCICVPLVSGNQITVPLFHTHGSDRTLSTAWCGLRWIGPLN